MISCRSLLLIIVALPYCAGCSGGQEQADAGDAASANDAADAGPPCPESLPSGTCPSAGQTCFYGVVPGNYHENRCDCVSPEMQWQCCNLNQAFGCYGQDTMMVGSLCCPQDINLSPMTIGCAYCYPDGGEVDLFCSSNDRHWRQSTKSCVYTPPTCPDGGPAPLDGGSCDGDDSGSDASLDGGVDASVDAGASDASGQ